MLDTKKTKGMILNVGNDTCDELHFFKYVLNPN